MSVSPGASPSLTLASVRNPFLHQVVTDPWDLAEADVPQINAKVFEECRCLIDEVATMQRATSLLLHGIAGSGKTHVLARLRTHLQSRSGGPGVVFVSVRMDCAPTRMWRHFRRRLVDDLLRPWEDSQSRLQLMLRDRVREYATFEKLGETLRLSYALTTVLSRFHEGRFRNECAAWLRGDALRETVLANLGVPVDGPEDESLEEQAHEVVVHLCRLAAPDPVVFCCDEMEALETYSGDQKGLFAYAKAGASLVQEVTNALVISSVQSVFVKSLEDAVHESLFQKISLNRADLQPLTWVQGRHLLLSRMSAVPELAALRAQHARDSLWPLPERDLRQEFEPGDACVARRLIHRAKEFFEAARGLPIPTPVSLPEMLAAKFAEYWDQAARRGAHNADDILLQGIPMLLDLTGRRITYNQDELPKTVDLLAGSSAGPIAVSICNQENLGALARRLRRMLDSPPQHANRTVLLRDSRLAIGNSAVKCHERLKMLGERGAILVQPPPEVLYALDAMRNLLADAAAGNLTHNGEPVTPASVRDWLASNIPHVLQRFLDNLSGDAGTGKDGAAPPFARELLDFVTERFVVSVDEAARAIKVPDEEICKYALGNPGQVGYLAGPPGVLFRFVPDHVGGESDRP